MSSSSSSSDIKMYTLKTSDNELFEVEEAVALLSQTIKHVIDDGCADSAIPLQNITGHVMVLVIRHCKEQLLKNKKGDVAREYSEEEEEKKDYDAQFVKEVSVDQNMLFDLILAANYLNIKSLLDLLCKAVADMMAGKTPDHIRKIFHIKNDFTEEEMAEIKRENQCAFE